MSALQSCTDSTCEMLGYDYSCTHMNNLGISVCCSDEDYPYCNGDYCTTGAHCASGMCNPYNYCYDNVDTSTATAKNTGSSNVVAIVVPILVVAVLLILFGICQYCYRSSRNNEIKHNEEKFRK